VTVPLAHAHDREPGSDDDNEATAVDLAGLRREEAKRDREAHLHSDRATGVRALMPRAMRQCAPQTAADGGPPPPTDDDYRAPTDGQLTVPHGKQQPPARVVTLADIQPREVEWLWPGRLPAGMVAVLDGEPGTGKSTVVIDLIARLTTGRPLPNETETDRAPVDVALLGHEDSPEHTIRPRLDAAGADCARVHMLAEIGGRFPRLPDDGDVIERVVRDTRAKLVVVDPVSAYIGQADLHRDNEVRAALAPLAAIAERTGATILMLRHHRKSGGTGAIGRGLGSVAIIALARAGMTLAEDPDDPKKRVLAWSKLSVARLPQSLRWSWKSTNGAPRITWEGVCDLTADALVAAKDRRDRLGGGSGEHTASATDAAEVWLMDYLDEHGGEAPAREITKAGVIAGHTGRALRRARERLGLSVRQVGVPGQAGSAGWYWRTARLQAPKTSLLASDPGGDSNGDRNPNGQATLWSAGSDAGGSGAHLPAAADCGGSAEPLASE
jgi:hypothetical protein